MTKKLSLTEMTKRIPTIILPIQDLGECKFSIYNIISLKDNTHNIIFIQCNFKPYDLNIINGEIMIKSLQVYAKYINDNYVEYKDSNISLSSYHITTDFIDFPVDLFTFITNRTNNYLKHSGVSIKDLINFDIPTWVSITLEKIEFDPNFIQLYRSKQKKLKNIVHILEKGKTLVEVDGNPIECQYVLTNIQSKVYHSSELHDYWKNFIEPDFEFKVTATLEIMDKDFEVYKWVIVESIENKFRNLGVNIIQIK